MLFIFLNLFGGTAFICYIIITIVIAATGLSASFDSLKKALEEEPSRRPPKLAEYVFSYRADEKNGKPIFDYPIRIGLSFYTLVVNTLATILVSALWPIGLILVAIPYLCYLFYNWGKTVVPILRHLDKNKNE